ncbi:MAG: type II toxin-antitoxin system PemK/MazF family toxin [Propionibacteriaceae bacterium]|jgi:mRNA interferase MazF|nr:type II toxin-antitoxin system PemK/MazF family toxin [Propionibacteriaceae bacterium]
MRAIVLAQLDKPRPALVLTREIAQSYLTSVTVAPITSTIRGLSTEVLLDHRNGLDHNCVASCDNITTIPATAILRQIGLLLDDQEAGLSRAINAAFDLRREEPKPG